MFHSTILTKRKRKTKERKKQRKKLTFIKILRSNNTLQYRFHSLGTEKKFYSWIHCSIKSLILYISGSMHLINLNYVKIFNTYSKKKLIASFLIYNQCAVIFILVAKEPLDNIFVKTRDTFHQFYDSTRARDIRCLCNEYLFFTQHSHTHCGQLDQLQDHS